MRAASGRPLLPWALFLVGLAVTLAGVTPAAGAARLFFFITLLGGIVAAAGLLGPRAQLAAALLLLSLVATQRLVERPLAIPPSSQWTTPLAGPSQVVRHTVRLPTGDPAWPRLWTRAVGAAVFVCARGPLIPEDGLLLHLGDEPVARLTQEQAFGARPQPTSIGFYRLPVSRTLLERHSEAVFTLRRAPGSTPRPIDICGTFSYRPTAGPNSSAFFDGATWTSPGAEKGGRFLIEVRLEDAAGRPFSIWY